MAKVVTYGELLMRLNPPHLQRFSQARRFELYFVGGEANVAASCANYGHASAFVTALPDNDLAVAAKRHLNYWGIDTSHILTCGERIGIVFVEAGASQRASNVIYDRRNSAVSEADPSAYDWPKILTGCDWFHTTGITPALSPGAATAARDALKAARDAGARTSFDLNYRRKLWDREAARRGVEPLLEYVDVLIGNEEDAKDVLGIEAEHTDIDSGKVDRDAYRGVCEQIRDRYGIQRVAITLRESESASINHWSGAFLDGDAYYLGRRYTMHIVDRIGGGDSFVGGLIHGLVEEQGPEWALEFAVAASCLKHTIHGDFNAVTRDEVEALMSGSGSGRVQR